MTSVQTLNGTWKLATDPANEGRSERWFKSIRPDAQDAPVPGIIQQAYPGYHGVAWYWHSFRCNIGQIPGERVRIRFGAVDYLAEVWLNGKFAGSFEGGETPFEFDVTNALKCDAENLLAVRVL
ncbi:MAG: beta galactosidase jelly roll domain-containing protein, partial [Phycisphaerae bacterium]|nr:beta galactosidase jelly roll domain-containing protein [Phycisphaerae bacterium]